LFGVVGVGVLTIGVEGVEGGPKVIGPLANEMKEFYLPSPDVEKLTGSDCWAYNLAGGGV
jgi:hypothetical protein